MRLRPLDEYTRSHFLPTADVALGSGAIREEGDSLGRLWTNGAMMVDRDQADEDLMWQVDGLSREPGRILDAAQKQMAWDREHGAATQAVEPVGWWMPRTDSHPMDSLYLAGGGREIAVDIGKWLFLRRLTAFEVCYVTPVGHPQVLSMKLGDGTPVALLAPLSGAPPLSAFEREEATHES